MRKLRDRNKRQFFYDGDQVLSAINANRFQWRKYQQERADERATFGAFGCKGDGSTDDTSAFQDALNSGKRVSGVPGHIYRITSTLTVTGDVNIDLNGATIQSEVTSGHTITRDPATLTSYGVSTQSWGSNQVTASSTPSAFAVGDYAGITTTQNSGYFPPSYRRVNDITGSVITVDNDYNFSYPGTLTVTQMAFSNSFRLSNGTIECSNVTTAAGTLIELSDYEHVHISNLNIDTCDLGTVSASKYIILIDKCLNVTCRDVNISDSICGAQAIGATRCGNVTIDACEFDGDAFGFGAEKCDNISLSDNKIMGRNFSGGTESVRGLKLKGCQSGTITGNTVRNFDTGIRLSETGNAVIDGNRVDLCGYAVMVDDDTVDATWYVGNIVTNNNIHRPQNMGILVDDNNNHAIVSGNHVFNAQAEGIRVDGNGCVVTNNYIFEWDLGSTSSPAIILGDAKTQPSTFDNNCAYTATASKTCFNLNASSTALFVGQNQSNTTTKYAAVPAATTGGTGSAGAGNQYVAIEVSGTVYNVLHD